MKRNANTLCFTLPGFKHPIYVPFTGRRLAVCERCKKNFKTRDHCRTRDCHVDLPWSETFVCVSLDPSCTDEDGDLLDGPFYARAVPPIAFNYSGELDRKTPICAPCKDKNYTRNYCRKQKRHRQLPWSTVYVILTLTPNNFYGYDFPYSSPQNTYYSPEKRRKGNSGEIIKIKDELGNDDDKKVGGDEEQPKVEANDSSENKTPDDRRSKGEEKGDRGDKVEKESLVKEKEEKCSGETDENDDDKEEVEVKKGKENDSQTDGDDKSSDAAVEEKKKTSDEEEAEKMKNIPRSRTLLANISCNGITIEWLDLDPVLQSQYNHLKPYSPRSYDSPHEGPMGGFPMGMGNMMGMGMHMGMGSSPMGMGGNMMGMGMGMLMSGGMNSMGGMIPMGMGMGGMNYGYMGMGGDMSGGSTMNNYDRSPMHSGMSGAKRGGGGGGGGSRGYQSPQGMQVSQYDMTRKGQGSMSNENVSNPNNNSPYDGAGQGGVNTMNPGQWTPYSTPDYYGISPNSVGDSGGGGRGMNMQQSQMPMQRQHMYKYGQWGPIPHGRGIDKESNQRQESDADFDGRGQNRRDSDEDGKKRKEFNRE